VLTQVTCRTAYTSSEFTSLRGRHASAVGRAGDPDSAPFGFGVDVRPLRECQAS
jgi:hypothetical protein